MHIVSSFKKVQEIHMTASKSIQYSIFLNNNNLLVHRYERLQYCSKNQCYYRVQSQLIYFLTKSCSTYL